MKATHSARLGDAVAVPDRVGLSVADRVTVGVSDTVRVVETVSVLVGGSPPPALNREQAALASKKWPYLAASLALLKITKAIIGGPKGIAKAWRTMHRNAYTLVRSPTVEI